MASSTILALLASLLVVVAKASNETCVFTTEEGKKLEFPTMDGHFNASDPTASKTFYYNPCTKFTSGGCSNVMVCMQAGFNVSENVGIGNSTTTNLTKNGDGDYMAKYSQDEMTSFVLFKCDPSADSATFTYTPSKDINSYYFTLKSQMVCLDPPTTPSSTSVSPNSTSPSTSVSPKSTTPRSTDTTTHSGSKSLYSTFSMGVLALVAVVARRAF